MGTNQFHDSVFRVESERSQAHKVNENIKKDALSTVSLCSLATVVHWQALEKEGTESLREHK